MHTPRILRTQTGYAIDEIQVEKLPTRQAQVLLLIAKGNTETEIAAELNCSAHTIRGQKKTLFFKFNADSVASLVCQAFVKKSLSIYEPNNKKAA